MRCDVAAVLPAYWVLIHALNRWTYIDEDKDGNSGLWTADEIAFVAAVVMLNHMSAWDMTLGGGSVFWLSLLFIAAVWIYGLRPFQRYALSHIPGPRVKWLFGNVGEVRKYGGQHFANQAFAKRYGPVYKLFLGARSIVALEDPELARQVLLHSSTRPNLMAGSVLPHEARERAQSSILWENSSRWRSLRASWQPMFFTGSLKGYLQIMDKAAQLLVAELQTAAAESRELDIHAAMADMSLAAISEAAFGVDLHAQKADKTASVSNEERMRSRRVREAASSMFAPTNTSIWVLLAGGAPFLLPILRIFAHRFPDKPLETMIRSRKTMDAAVEQLFADHRAALASSAAPSKGSKLPAQNGQGQGGNGLRKGVDPGSFIALLIEANDRSTGQVFPDGVLAQQALTVLLAGMETTANTLAFACYLLARPCNAEKQAALAAEVDAFGRDRQPSFEDLDQLPYLDAVLKEALRLFPPAHTVLREAEHNMALGDHKVKKRQWLAVPIFSIHNNPKYWPEADVFLPERWLEGHPEKARQPKHAYLPFGEGPRVCVGMRFAMEEAKLTLLRMYQKFTLVLTPGQEPLDLRASITLSPSHGVLVRPIPRT